MAKALTICQPYAHLIMRGDKRVENRTWPTRYRGALYIHAGKSRDWLDDDGDGIDYGYNIRIDAMAFGAVVAICTLADCLPHDCVVDGVYDKKYPWLRTHEHAEGPWCWVLTNVHPIGPWPWRGAQGLWDIDEKALERIANRESGIAELQTEDPK